jgi:hypothetical protein
MPQYSVHSPHASTDMRERTVPPIPESNVSSSSISIIIPEDSLRGLPECVRQQSWLRRQAGNTGAIASRNALSVVVPTALQEFIRRFIFSRIAVGYGADLLTPYLGSIGANVVARAGVNFFGECLDDTTSLASTAYLTRQQVRTHTYFNPPSEHTWNEVADRILNIHAGRSALFSSTFSAAFLANLPTDDHTSPAMVSTVKPRKTMGRESLTTPTYNHLGLLKQSISVGIAAEVGYFPFILTSDQTAPRNQMDLEANLGQQGPPSNAIEMTHFRRINE